MRRKFHSLGVFADSASFLFKKSKMKQLKLRIVDCSYYEFWLSCSGMKSLECLQSLSKTMNVVEECGNAFGTFPKQRMPSRSLVMPSELSQNKECRQICSKWGKTFLAKECRRGCMEFQKTGLGTVRDCPCCTSRNKVPCPPLWVAPSLQELSTHPRRATVVWSTIGITK